MKKLLLSTAAIAAMGMFAGSAQAANFDTADATAQVVAPITVTAATNMTFGNIALIIPGQPGTVYTNGDTPSNVTVSGTPAAATFTVAYDSTFNYGLTVTNTNLSDQNTVDSNETGIPMVLTVSTTDNRLGAVTVDGTLVVNADQDADAYAGSITVTANYQ